MIRTLAHIRLLTAIVGIWYDWLVWTRYLFGTNSPDNERMLADGWGWWSAGMDPHWTRLWDPAQPFCEALKNLYSEWCRLDPERAGKVGSFLIGWSWILAFGLGFLLGRVA